MIRHPSACFGALLAIPCCMQLGKFDLSLRPDHILVNYMHETLICNLRAVDTAEVAVDGDMHDMRVHCYWWAYRILPIQVFLFLFFSKRQGTLRTSSHNQR